MPAYVSLMHWTEHGITNYKDSLDRYEAAKAAGALVGVKFRDIYWTVGSYDLVSIIEAPDEETVAAFQLAAGAAGNLRTTTMRAFDKDEMKAIIATAAEHTL
jgi:uncharacterized protein with GYD domain